MGSKRLREKHLIKMMQEDEKQGLYQIPPKKEVLLKQIKENYEWRNI